MLVFLAAEKARVPELRQAIRSRLAWQSILDEQGAHYLNLTPADVNQAKTRREEADRTVDLRIGETFSQVLYPVQSPGQADIHWSSVRVSRSCRPLRAGGQQAGVVPAPDNGAYAGTLVRRDLDRPEAPLWDGDHVGVRTLWSYYCRYLYMPQAGRLRRARGSHLPRRGRFQLAARHLRLRRHLRHRRRTATRAS